MTVNSELVLNFLKKNYGKDYTKQEIANALGISLPSVTGTINGLIKKNYVVTTHVEEIVEAEATETRKAKIKNVPYHTLTEAGLAYDPVAEEAAKQAAKEAAKAERAAAKAAAKGE
jgi:Mn-dependent DtxR family transcriptional regulator